MQILTIDKDKFVAVEGDRATVYSRTELEKELEHAIYNIEQCERNITELQTQKVPVESLHGKQLKAVEQFNANLGIDRYRQEIKDCNENKKVISDLLERL